MSENNKPRVGNYRGIKSVVEPIRFSRQLGLISDLLKDKPRDLLIFTLGINSGLRAKDLLNLKVFQVRDLPINGILRITETKTKKSNILVINSAIHKVLHEHLSKANLKDENFLFQTKYGRQLSSVYLGRMIQEWCRKCEISGTFGCHSLRKSWAFHMRIKFKIDWALITTRLNHSNPIITRRYLGIEESEVIAILQNIVE